MSILRKELFKQQIREQINDLPGYQKEEFISAFIEEADLIDKYEFDNVFEKIELLRDYVEDLEERIENVIDEIDNFRMNKEIRTKIESLSIKDDLIHKHIKDVHDDLYSLYLTFDLLINL